MDKKSPEAFRTISEVAEWLGVPAHVLRFWESRFGQVKPVKRAGGRRYYRPSDMELLGGIRKLLHEDGMTIRGVQKLLRENGVKHVAAMSPPIDQPADLRLVHDSEKAETQTAAPGEQAPVFDSEVEDAGEDAIEDAVGAEAAETGPDAVEPDAVADAAEEAVAEPADLAAAGGEIGEPAPEAEVAPDAGMFSETAPAGGEAADDQSMFAAETDAAPEEAAESDLLDGPEAVEFFAHEAEPETVEDEGEAAFDSMFAEAASDATAETAADTAADASEAAPGRDTSETATPDAEEPAIFAAAPSPLAPAPEAPMYDTEAPAADEVAAQEAPAPVPDSAPQAEAGQTGAQTPADAPPAAPPGPVPDTEPEPGTPSTPDIGDAAEPGTLPEAARPETVPAASAPPPSSPRTGQGDRELVMPEIGPDPEDDAAIRLSRGLAAALRRHRAGGAAARLNPALLRAYGDRLEALAGRLGTSSDGRRPF